MKTLLVTTPKGTEEPEDIRHLLPRKLTGWDIKFVASGSLSDAGDCPVTVVQLKNDTPPAVLKAAIPGLAHLQGRTESGSFVVFAFEGKGKQRKDITSVINSSLSQFPHPERVELGFAGEELSTRLDFIRAKLRLARKKIPTPLFHKSSRPPRPSPLDEVKEIIAATGDLRSSNGKLSAVAVANVFGISVKQLSGWLGRSRQSVNQAPEADSLQADLSFFERVARLRAAISKDKFLKWLRMPNSDLDEKSPLDLMASGERQVVADLVDDMLTGAPT